MTKIVLTGGAGFVGSHVAEHLLEVWPAAQLTILDKMTYAADFRNIASALAHRHTQLIVGDICELETCLRATRGAELVFHLAAESHVDASFGNSLQFTRVNTLGTHTLLEACRQNHVPRFVHVSTDEVYGQVLTGACTEASPLAPTNPYAASKAAAEMILAGYRTSFGFPALVCRANNIFGTRQYPEKIIPTFCLALARGHAMTVHGDGSHVRSYLAVQDVARALVTLAERGRIGETYNIGTTEEYENLAIARMIRERFGVDEPGTLRFVADRPFNDRRYSVDCAKIHALGWRPERTLAGELGGIVAWYRAHAERYARYERSAPVSS